MSKCVDRSDLTTLNSLALNAGPTVDDYGVYTLNQIDVLAQEVADNIVRDAEKNPILIAVNRYGNVFYDASNFINNDFRNNFTGEYPDLQRRWDKGNISNLEFADFLNQYNYTPTGVIESRNYEKLARELDNYYKDTFSTSILGGLCNTIQQIFGAVDAFFDILATVDAIIADAVTLLNKIRSYDGITDFIQKEIIDKLIREIKEKIAAVIAAVIQAVRDAIANFDILLATANSISTKATKAVMTAKEQTCVALSKENEQKFIDKVKATIDYLIGLLESPGLEQIQLIVARICALATNIEALIKDIKSPLDSFGINYERVVRRVQNIGKISTSTAIRNGAIRYSPEAVENTINSLNQLWDGSAGERRITPTGKEPVQVKPITKEEYKNLPKCGDVISGSDSRVEISGDWVEDLGPQGYSRVDLDVKVYLMRVQALMQVKFNIVSGWRSKEYNDKIGGDRDSSHLSGLVIDIENSGFDVDEFTDAALRSGFKNVVIYNDYIHLDIREMAL